MWFSGGAVATAMGGAGGYGTETYPGGRYDALCPENIGCLDRLAGR